MFNFILQKEIFELYKEMGFWADYNSDHFDIKKIKELEKIFNLKIEIFNDKTTIKKHF